MEASNMAKVPRDELIARARDLIPLVREKADQAERQRMVAPEVMAALKDADTFRILQPERFGGF